MQPRVPEKVLKKYYELWLKGVPLQKIKVRLKMDTRKFNQLTPDFLAYCRHQIKFDTRANLANGDLPDFVKLTPERADDFVEYISAGLDYPTAAKIMNVPIVTVLEVWFKDKVFKDRVETAVELTNARVVMALYRSAIGYEFKYNETSVTDGTNKDGEPYSSETITRKTKHFPPNVAAGKFWVFNRDPDNWTIDGERIRGHNKGKILEFIQEQIEDVGDDKMNKFDKEQEKFDERYYK